MERRCEKCQVCVGDAGWLVTLSRPATGAGRGEHGDGLGDGYEWCLSCALSTMTDDGLLDAPADPAELVREIQRHVTAIENLNGLLAQYVGKTFPNGMELRFVAYPNKVN